MAKAMYTSQYRPGAIRRQIRGTSDEDRMLQAFKEIAPYVDFSQPNAMENAMKHARNLSQPGGLKDIDPGGWRDAIGREGVKYVQPREAVREAKRMAEAEYTRPGREAQDRLVAAQTIAQRTRDATVAALRAKGQWQGGHFVTPEGTVIPEKMYEQAKLEERYPLARLPAEQQVNAARATAQARAEEIAPQLAKNAAMRDALRARQAKGPYDQIAAGEVRDLEQQADDLRAEEHRMRAAAETPTPAGVRAGDRPTMQGFAFSRETAPLVGMRDSMQKRATTLGQQAMDEPDPAKRAQLWQQYGETARAAKALEAKIARAPQAPEAQALGADQAEIQTDTLRKVTSPEWAAQNQALIGAGGAAYGAVMGQPTPSELGPVQTPFPGKGPSGTDQLARIKARAAEIVLSGAENPAALKVLGLDKTDPAMLAGVRAAFGVLMGKPVMDPITQKQIPVDADALAMARNVLENAGLGHLIKGQEQPSGGGLTMTGEGAGEDSPLTPEEQAELERLRAKVAGG